MFCRRALPILSSPWPQSVKGLIPRHSHNVPKAGTEFAQNSMRAATPNGAVAGYVVAVSNRWNQRHVEKPHQMHLGTQPPCHAKHEFTFISRQCHHNIFRLMRVGMFSLKLRRWQEDAKLRRIGYKKPLFGPPGLAPPQKEILNSEGKHKYFR